MRGATNLSTPRPGSGLLSRTNKTKHCPNRGPKRLRTNLEAVKAKQGPATKSKKLARHTIDYKGVIG